MPRRRAAALLVMVALAVTAAAAACGDGSRPAGVRTVLLDIRFSRFSTSVLTARPGELVRFVVRNHDPIPHELIVGDEGVQDRHERGTEAQHGHRPGEVSVPAGATAETTYRFVSTGQLLFGCHLPGHWDYGMRGTIIVV